EDDEADQVDAFRSEPVAQSAGDQQRHHICEQIRRGDPDDGIDVGVEGGHDVGHGDGDDRRVDEDHEEAEAQRPQRPPRSRDSVRLVAHRFIFVLFAVVVNPGPLPPGLPPSGSPLHASCAFLLQGTPSAGTWYNGTMVCRINELLIDSHWSVVIIGAGQAGLSAAHYLWRDGMVPGRDFLVLDAGAGPGGAWRERWDSLTLGRTNHVADLPG